MKIAIIIDEEETRTSFRNYLSEDRAIFKKVYAFNSIDTFISDAYMLTDVDVILLDMHLSAGIPSLEGFDIINKTPFLDTARVLMLTSVSDNNYHVFKWLCRYGSSYIDREKPFFNIKKAILTIHEKGHVIAPIATKRNSVTRKENAAPEYKSSASLTSREMEVIHHVLDRQTEKQIGKFLNIRPALVRKYIRSAYRKLLGNVSSTIPISQKGSEEMNYRRVG